MALFITSRILYYWQGILTGGILYYWWRCLSLAGSFITGRVFLLEACFITGGVVYHFLWVLYHWQGIIRLLAAFLTSDSFNFFLLLAVFFYIFFITGGACACVFLFTACGIPYYRLHSLLLAMFYRAAVRVLYYRRLFSTVGVLSFLRHSSLRCFLVLAAFFVTGRGLKFFFLLLLVFLITGNVLY